MMPSKSPAQKRMMAAAAHDPAFAKKVGVPQTVAKEFNQADMRENAMKAIRKNKNAAMKKMRNANGY